jgi:glutamate-1-semialdehyde 2,1-aminomutase
MQKITAIVQARMGSTRFPGKVLKQVGGIPLIGHLLQRISLSKKIDQIILATSEALSNDDLCKYVQSLHIHVFRGSENDVLDRYYNAAKDGNAQAIIRLTGDCPLLDYQVIDSVINVFQTGKYDYVSNINPPTFPDGLDTELFTFNALETAWREATEPFDREHVTPFIRKADNFKKYNLLNDIDLSNERWTVDTPEDFILIKKIIEDLSPKKRWFGIKDIIEYKEKNKSLFEINSNFRRNEGANMSTGQKLWQRAKKVIAGGNSLLSKRPDMFLPDQWPSYFEKAKGITVWDLDNIKYIDMSIMGIGTNILGYANDEVDKEVRSVIDRSNGSTLNCPEEVYFAEKLIELHPWAEMVRYSRTGGEACAIAIRIARAASGKDKIAFCGYHGWSDWYLAANLSEESNLDGQLLPGLQPKGVPRGLTGTMFPFNYNDYDKIAEIVAENDIGTIIMEPVRNHDPQDDFLLKVRQLASEKGIVLIFDEITSGFRRSVGGIHLHYGVNPDVAVLGKAMGNGYAISAIIGIKNVMEYAQTTFISSTFWTERIGPVAALAAIKAMQRYNAPAIIHAQGEYINSRWKQLALKHHLDIEISGIPALTHFSFRNQDNLLIKSIITQEMLKKGYLASNALYVCMLHTNEVIDSYILALDEVFGILKRSIDNNTLSTLLNGKICQSGFKRLT